PPWKARFRRGCYDWKRQQRQPTRHRALRRRLRCRLDSLARGHQSRHVAFGVSATLRQQRISMNIWHPYTQEATEPPPIEIARGDGAYVYTKDGRRLLDGISSWWVNLHG